MSKEKKRYVVQVDMYVYAENDYMVRKRANDYKMILGECDAHHVSVTEIGEQPFGKISSYRKLDDPTFIPKDLSHEPLPF